MGGLADHHNVVYIIKRERREDREAAGLLGRASQVEKNGNVLTSNKLNKVASQDDDHSF